MRDGQHERWDLPTILPNRFGGPIIICIGVSADNALVEGIKRLVGRIWWETYLPVGERRNHTVMVSPRFWSALGDYLLCSVKNITKPTLPVAFYQLRSVAFVI